MKTRMNVAGMVLMLLALLSSPHTASAYYDPGVQRWINRDPLGEPGFETKRSFTTRGRINTHFSYVFVLNGPINFTDGVGLAVNDPPGCADGMTRTITSVLGCRWGTIWLPFNPYCPVIAIPIQITGYKICKVDQSCRGGRWNTARGPYNCSQCQQLIGDE